MIRALSNPVTVHDGIVMMVLNNGHLVYLDATDLGLVWPYHWTAVQPNKKGAPLGIYACTHMYDKVTKKYKTTYMHRLITNAPSGMEVDHVNHDGLDNRRENLEVKTHAQNLMNQRGANKRSTTGIRGVYIKHEVPHLRYYVARVGWHGKHYTRQFPFTEEGKAEATQYAALLREGFMHIVDYQEVY